MQDDRTGPIASAALPPSALLAVGAPAFQFSPDDAGKLIGDGLKQYVAEVTGKVFPAPENYFGMKDEEYDELVRQLG